MADAMLTKQTCYETLICCDLAELERVLDPRFSNGLVREYNVLSKYIDITSEEVDVSAHQGTALKSGDYSSSCSNVEMERTLRMETSCTAY